MDKSDLNEKVNSLDLQELRELNERVVERIKLLNRAKASQKISKLEEGMTVEVNHEKLHGLHGTIQKIKRTKVLVKYGTKVYDVPAELVSEVKDVEEETSV